jgi:hypothetical protein
MDTAIVDNTKVMALAARLAQLKGERDKIDAEIADVVSQLVKYVRSVSISVVPTQAAAPANGNGAVRLPPAESLQGRVLTWLREQAMPVARNTVATGINHPAKATESTLRAMQSKGLVRRTNRGWEAAA